ncbi:MAG: leucine-rich repeat protein [Clostridia bacterium]|nr:leucine-rich repeat protein [Clostridia bacterium]
MKKMFKKAISVFLVVAMFLCAAPFGGLVGLDLSNLFDFEARAEDYGWECDNHEYSYSEFEDAYGVRFEGKMCVMCGASVAKIVGCSEKKAGEIVIDHQVGYYYFFDINDNAFNNCDSLTSVLISGFIYFIGDSAFYDCDNITSFSFTNTSELLTIGDNAFYSCDSLTRMLIPYTTTSIGSGAFADCKSLEYVHIPASVTDIGSNILSGTSAHICSETADCYAKTYAENNGIEFRICNGDCPSANLDNNPNDDPADTPDDNPDDNPTDDPNDNTTDNPNDNPDDNPNDKPTDTPTNKTYKFYNREFKHNLDYFAKNGDSSKYDPELANLLAALSAAAYDEETIKNAYKELGFDDCETFNYDGFTLGKVAYSLAFKKSDNSDETICLVSVRGTVNNSEWFGNANISTTNGKHDGFLNATNQIYDNIQNYIDSNNITGDVKYFVTGHSRGAAVSNLLSVNLMEDGVASSNVYNYNYACPDVATKAVFPDYFNIFNLCNTADVVPFVPGELGNALESDSHWGKYGRTHWFTVDIPNTGDTVQDVVNDHNVNLYLGYMDKQLDTSEFHREPTDNGVIGHNAKIQCPVDVVITDESDKNIASVINGEINYYDSAFGDVIILTDGDKKFIYINGDNDFNINLVGTDNGKMTYSIEKYNIFTKETLESKTFENVKLEKGKEMYSPVSDAENTDEVKLFVVDDGAITHRITEDGTEIDYSWVNEHSFEMKSPLNATVKYGDTLVLQADLGETALPEGWSIKWDVDGAGFNMTPAEDGLTCNMTSVANGNATVKATLVDETGEVVLNAEGNEISAEITLKSNASFWQKIVSFFKNLFRINRIIY